MIMRFYEIMFSNVLTNGRERIDWGKDVVCIKDSLGLKDNAAGNLFTRKVEGLVIKEVLSEWRENQFLKLSKTVSLLFSCQCKVWPISVQCFILPPESDGKL